MTTSGLALGALAAITVGAVIVLAVSTPSPMFAKDTVMTRSTTQPSPPALADLAKATGLTFPSTARLLAFESEAGIDTSIHATLAMSTADLAAFLAANAIDPTGLRAAMRAMLGRDVGSWTPSRAPTLVAAQVQRGPGRVLNIGVAEADGQATVYLHWFTT